MGLEGVGRAGGGYIGLYGTCKASMAWAVPRYQALAGSWVPSGACTGDGGPGGVVLTPLSFAFPGLGDPPDGSDVPGPGVPAEWPRAPKQRADHQLLRVQPQLLHGTGLGAVGGGGWGVGGHLSSPPDPVPPPHS